MQYQPKSPLPEDIKTAAGLKLAHTVDIGRDGERKGRQWGEGGRGQERR